MPPCFFASRILQYPDPWLNLEEAYWGIAIAVVNHTACRHVVDTPQCSSLLILLLSVLYLLAIPCSKYRALTPEREEPCREFWQCLTDFSADAAAIRSSPISPRMSMVQSHSGRSSRHGLRGQQSSQYSLPRCSDSIVTIAVVGPSRGGRNQEHRL